MGPVSATSDETGLSERDEDEDATSGPVRQHRARAGAAVPDFVPDTTATDARAARPGR